MWKECYNLLNETFLLHGYALIESRKISWIRFLVSTFTIVIISQMSTVGSFYFFHLEICSHWWKSELIFDFTGSFFFNSSSWGTGKNLFTTTKKKLACFILLIWTQLIYFSMDQVRCLLETPLFVKQGQMLTGKVLLLANKRYVS